MEKTSHIQDFVKKEQRLNMDDSTINMLRSYEKELIEKMNKICDDHKRLYVNLKKIRRDLRRAEVRRFFNIFKKGN